MILLDIFCLLVGAVLAQRYKVMVLLPATALVLTAAVGTGLLQSYTVERTILIAAAGSASLQGGYLFGLGVRYLLEAPSRERQQKLRASTSARHPAPTTPLT